MNDSNSVCINVDLAPLCEDVDFCITEKCYHEIFCREEKPEEPELPKYRDRAKERREDQNPDYEPTELGSFHAVAPPGTVDLRSQISSLLSPLSSLSLSPPFVIVVYNICYCSCDFNRSAESHKISIEHSKYLGGSFVLFFPYLL